MNGKLDKAVHIVDRKAEKVKAVNRAVNRKFKKRAGADEWEFIPQLYLDAARLIGRILFIPVVLLFAVLEGVRAGFIAGVEKALAMYR